MKDRQIEYTTQTEVCCDGISVGTILLDNMLKTLGHPKIYLKFAPGQKELVCPYCSKVFAYKA